MNQSGWQGKKRFRVEIRSRSQERKAPGKLLRGPRTQITTQSPPGNFGHPEVIIVKSFTLVTTSNHIRQYISSFQTVKKNMMITTNKISKWRYFCRAESAFRSVKISTSISSCYENSLPLFSSPSIAWLSDFYVGPPFEQAD